MSTTTEDELRDALKASRLAAYHRLRGGYPIPLAGALYWIVLTVLGTRLELPAWCMTAFIGTGLIFPVALILSKILNVQFMKDKAAVDDLMIPAFLSMLMFWAYIVAAGQVAPELLPLILAIGLSIHWPVIGWTYGRTALFSAHTLIRTASVTALWLMFPENRLVFIPAAVALIYLGTVAAILIDVKIINKGAASQIA
ncbi:MAG: hypothetical protein V2I43_06665 [Parvularcula sp.]|jgi:hypothetical protein|nr:hypothetical protein [Parvularcula sp.]